MSFLALATAKEMLQIAHTGQDNVIQILIDGIEDWIQKWCNIYFEPTSVLVETQEDFSSDDKKCLFPKRLPISSIVQIVDRDDDDAVVETDTYEFTNGRIIRKDDDTWGEGDVRWRVTYKGGYLSSTLPAGLKMLMYQLVYRAYNKRGGLSSSGAAGVSVGWEGLMDSDMLRQLRMYKLGQQVIG